jgi:thiamine monophosphate kinase
MRRVSRLYQAFPQSRPPYAPLVGKEIVKNDITDAMMDVSDGLILDLSRMMKESRKQAPHPLGKGPRAPPAEAEGLEDLAFGGGED